MSQVTLAPVNGKIMIVCGDSAIALSPKGALTMAVELPLAVHLANAQRVGRQQSAAWQGKARQLQFNALEAFGCWFSIARSGCVMWFTEAGECMALGLPEIALEQAYLTLLEMLDEKAQNSKG